MTKEAITAERLKGRQEGFSVLENYKKGISDDALAKEKDFFLNVETINDKTKAQIDAEAVRSENALLAIQRKELQGIADLIAKIQEGHEALKNIKFV